MYRRSLLLAIVVLTATLPGLRCSAQDQSSALTSVGAQATNVVLSQFVVVSADPAMQAPADGDPDKLKGKWSASPVRPYDCPHTTDTCVTVIYQVPSGSISCQWTVLLLGDGSSGSILSENDDAAKYFLAKLNGVDAEDLIVSRQQPSYSPKLRAKGKNYNIVLDINVSPEGIVENAQASRGTMTPFYGKQFIDPAIEAVKLWKFKPYVVGTRSVAFRTTVTFHPDQDPP